MTIGLTKNGLQVRKNYYGQDYLVIETSKLGEYIGYIKKGTIKNIEINGALGFIGDDLSFLKELAAYVRGLHLLETNVDYSAFDMLHGLKYLSFYDNKRDSIDLRSYPELELLATDYSLRLHGLSSLSKLSDLRLTNFAPLSRNVTEFTELVNLQGLYLIGSTVVSLKGIEQLSQLKKLQLYRANKLEDISDLAKLRYLEELEIENCENINNFDSIGDIDSLRRLKIFDSGSVPSIKFVEPLSQLEFLSFWNFNILDGNLSYLEKIPKVNFQNKKHYSHTIEQLSKE